MAQETRQVLMTARIITASLVAGVVIFWGVAWLITEGGTVGVSPDAFPLSIALAVQGAALLAGFGGALFFRGRALERPTGDEVGPVEHSPGTVMSSLIIAGVMIEFPGILSGVLFFLLGHTLVLWMTIPVYVLGIYLTFPRAEWFEAGAAAGAGAGGSLGR